MNADSSIHPRPIHRWRTFWAGILALTFLAWAWHDSTRHWSDAHFRRYSLSHAGSGLCLIKWGPDIGISPLRWSRSVITDEQYPWPRASIEAPATHHQQGDSQIIPDLLEVDPDHPDNLRPRSSAEFHFLHISWADSRAIFIPHWLLILTFITLWTALLLWRHRRLRHLTKPIG